MLLFQCSYLQPHIRLFGSDGKEFACNAGDPGSILGREDALEKGMATHSSTLAWSISLERRAWCRAYSPWRRKESDMTEQLTCISDCLLSLVASFY